jgi:hypothetical protein
MSMRELSDRSEALYHKLRSNDPETTWVSVDLLVHGCGPALGCALTNNTCVSRIVIDSGRLLLPCDNDITILAPFVEYLRNSPSLHDVALYETDQLGLVRSSLTSLIFAAITQNPKVFSLELYQLVSPLEGFIQFLGTTTSLKKLLVEHSVPLNQAQLFVDALNAVQTLEELELYEDQQTVDFILTQIGPRHRLRTLDVTCSSQGLSKLLRTTTVLQELNVIRQVFQEEEMTLLLAALASNHSVTKLHLKACSMYGAAGSLFSRFVRHDCNQGSNNIREVNVSLCNYDCDEANPMLQLVSSPLDVLSIDEPYGQGTSWLKQCFEELTSDPTLGKTQCWKVFIDRSTEIDAMIKYLPTTTTLRKFVVSGDKLEIARTAKFRRALRENGSLNSLTVEHRAGCSFDDALLVTLQRYCQRNQALPELLISPLNSEHSPSSRNLILFPSLFCVARQAPRTAPNMLLMGLLAAGSDSIGFYGNMKRQAD